MKNRDLNPPVKNMRPQSAKTKLGSVAVKKSKSPPNARSFDPKIKAKIRPISGQDNNKLLPQKT